jgi:hypothetical protein
MSQATRMAIRRFPSQKPFRTLTKHGPAIDRSRTVLNQPGQTVSEPCEEEEEEEESES